MSASSPSAASATELEIETTAGLGVSETGSETGAMPGLRLWHGVDGQLWGAASDPSGSEGASRSVRVCRLFPWSEPGRHVSLRDAEDEELALITDARDLDTDSRGALEIALAEAGFLMDIVRIEAVEEEIEIRTWEVETRQGRRIFQTERDTWPRQLPGGGLLIQDVAGDLYAIRNTESLDSRSRALLWVFLD